jgi:hypothetical protein
MARFCPVLGISSKRSLTSEASELNVGGSDPVSEGRYPRPHLRDPWKVRVSERGRTLKLLFVLGRAVSEAERRLLRGGRPEPQVTTLGLLITAALVAISVIGAMPFVMGRLERWSAD